MSHIISSAEFVGGPKDGLVVDADFILQLEERFDPDLGEDIRMMYDETEDLSKDAGEELHLLGRYICTADTEGHLVYKWSEALG
jgi:hypothetical protein